MSEGHPSAIELELARTAEASPAVTLHVRGCGICRAEVARLEELAATLRGIRESRIEVSADLDGRVLWHARSRARVARRTSSGRTLARWAAAAAVVLAVATTLLPGGLHRSGLAVAREDVDGNGTIDIRDALLLAHEVEAGHVSGTRDVNGDGVVNEEDVRRIALRAVALRS